MSNYYAKAINPRTGIEEECVYLDMGKVHYLEFKDGWKHNVKYIPTEDLTRLDCRKTIEEMTEQEAIPKRNTKEYIEMKKSQGLYGIVFTEEEAINQDGEEVMKQFGVSSNGEEGYPNFFDYSFTWRWRFIISILALGFLTALVSGVVTLVTFTMKLLGV